METVGAKMGIVRIYGFNLPTKIYSKDLLLGKALINFLGVIFSYGHFLCAVLFGARLTYTRRWCILVMHAE